MNEVQQDQQEQEQARQLRQERLRQRRSGFDRRLQAGGRLLSMLGKKRGDKTMRRLGRSMQRLGKYGGKIEARQHSTFGWLVAVILAIIKDLLDYGTLQFGVIIGWLVNAFIAVDFFLLFGRSVKLSHRLISILFSFIGEAIPVIGFLPLWTASVAYLYFKARSQS